MVTFTAKLLGEKELIFYNLILQTYKSQSMSRKERIEQQLLNEFNPIFLLVEDESSNHHVPENAQTHFKVIMATPQFSELSRVHRHRLINKLLQEEFNSGMHALSMYLYSPTEWETQDKSSFKSPACRDGYKNK